MTDRPDVEAVAAPNRSAMLVAACRALALHDPVGASLCDDPFARSFVDDRALADARGDPALQRVIWLRTRYIDDAVTAFVRTHRNAQVVLLGAGLDARALRLGLDARFFEVDLPATLAAKERMLGDRALASVSTRRGVSVDLASEGFAAPLRAAGLDPEAPTIAVLEGVTNYLSGDSAERLAAQLPDVVAPGGCFVVDYVPRRSFDRGFGEQTSATESLLRGGGDVLRSGFADIRVSLERQGFDVVDDEAIDLLAARYGVDAAPKRIYPARILTACRRLP
ncbi:MAG TPA: class I SAM-dependent methyltransferase [Acidimicrobiales bacterium]|nr:class I SAM-dependent methyltransferase [Acidimicrobiales bacterium]